MKILNQFKNKNIFKPKSITLKQFSTNFQEKFPYEFNRQKENNHSKKMNLSMNIFNKDLIQGIKIIYKNYLDSLKEKDLEYLKENCEPNFYNQLEEVVKDNHSIYLNNINEKDIKIEVDQILVEVHMGAFLNRELNKEITLITEKPPKLIDSIMSMFEFFSIYGYQNKSGKYSGVNIVLRIIAQVTSNYIISKENLGIVDKNFKETHKLIIEAESNDKDCAFYIMEQNHMLLKLLKKKDCNLNFILTDFDDFMNGNKLI